MTHSGISLHERAAPNSRSADQAPRFGRVAVWYEETGPSLSAAVAVALLALGFFWAFSSRPKRPPTAVPTVSMMPFQADVHGLEGGSRGADRREKLSDLQHEPLLDSLEPDAREATLDTPPRRPEFASTERIAQLTLGPDSGNTGDLFRQTAAEISKVDELLRTARNKAGANGERQRGSGGEEVGEQPSARFYGLGADGAKSVVYVIDCSGSMGKPIEKLGQAKRELIRSIRALRPDQSFFVIFFRHNADPMPGGELLPATAGNKKMALDWIVGIEAYGGTNPMPALRQALALHPEAIYILSDGQFNAESPAEMKRENHGFVRATIYTVGFGSRVGEAQLTRLAEESGGTYRFVDAAH